MALPDLFGPDSEDALFSHSKIRDVYKESFVAFALGLSGSSFCDEENVVCNFVAKDSSGLYLNNS